MTRLKGWLIRIWIRSRGLPRELKFLCDMTAIGRAWTRSDESLVDEFRFCVREAVWAISHFPSESVAQSWIEAKD